MWWYTAGILLLWTVPVTLGLELDEARYLLACTSFGGRPAEIAELRPESPIP